MQAKWTKRALYLVASIALTAGFVFAAFAFGPVAETFSALSEVRIWPLVAAMACLPFVQILRAWRFSGMVFAHAAFPDSRMIRIAALVVFFNGILPFRIGELSFPLLARRAFGLELARGFGILLTVRVYDMAALVFLGSVCILVLGEPASLYGLAIGLTFALVVGSAVARSVVIWIGASEAMLASAPFVADKLIAVARGVASISNGRRYFMFLLQTLAIWAVQFVICYLVLLAVLGDLGPNGFWEGSLAGAGAFLSFALPVNGIAGVGPMQAAWMLVLDQFHYVSSAALASGLLLNAVYVLGATVLAGTIFAFRIGQGSYSGDRSSGSTK